MYYCILAGGKSRRMGKNKAFLTLGDKYILELLLSRFSSCGANVCLSSADGKVGERLIHLNEKPQEVKDCVSQAGPAGGIYSLLKVLKQDIFVTATDMPFADVRLAQYLMELGGVGKNNGPDMVILQRADGRAEMLFGYYGLKCMKPLEFMLASGDYKLRNLTEKVRCVFISEKEICGVYGASCSRALFNMNTPQDYAVALDIFNTSCECPTKLS